MITDFILGILFLALQGLAALMPDTQLPGWVDDIGGMAGELFAGAQSLSVWIPWETILIVTGAVFAANVMGFGIKVTRMVISHVTGGGGSAA
jgi:hypothetical protein